MAKTDLFSPACVTATYSEQRLPDYRDNPLIEALPAAMSDTQVLEALTLMPAFDPAQREWPIHERIELVGGLSRCLFAQARHIDLAQAIDRMVRQGYVGREPRTKAHTEALQRIYEMQKAGTTFRQAASTMSQAVSCALIGMSGMGKSATTARFLATLPKVIYHPTLALYQITYLHVDAPADGRSIKGLCTAILAAVDKLIPGAKYVDKYVRGGRASAEILMLSTARVLQIHCVGVLVVDEIQNLANSRKGTDVAMTELTSACNVMKIPLLFIGTNKARRVLGADFRQARRSSGQGVRYWSALANDGSEDTPSEWDDFIKPLWRFQWTQNVVPLDPEFSAWLHDLCQGIVGVALMLFASAQVRAMHDGTEALSEEVFADVYENELQLLHPMLNALRNNDVEALMSYEDVLPLTLEDALKDIGSRVRGQIKHRELLALPDNPDYEHRLATSMAALGIDVDVAADVARAIANGEKSLNLVNAMQTALKAVNPTRKLKGKTNSKKPNDGGKSEDGPMPHPDRPADYRNAVYAAKQNGTSVLDELRRMGAARDVLEILPIA